MSLDVKVTAAAVVAEPGTKVTAAVTEPGTKELLSKCGTLHCGACPYTTTHASSLVKHQALHQGVRPYKCELCEYSTVQKKNLDVHQMKCDPSKPRLLKRFQCSTCSYVTSFKGNLKTHEFMHTGARPFKCGECPYRTNSRSNLTTHGRTHSGVRPFKCRGCEYSTTTRHNLKQHKCKPQPLSGNTLNSQDHEINRSKVYNSSTQNQSLVSPSGKRLYSCDMCDYSVVFKRRLVRHKFRHRRVMRSRAAAQQPQFMRAAAQQPQFMCHVCEYNAETEGTLAEHCEQVHTY